VKRLTVPGFWFLISESKAQSLSEKVSGVTWQVSGFGASSLVQCLRGLVVKLLVLGKDFLSSASGKVFCLRLAAIIFQKAGSD